MQREEILEVQLRQAEQALEATKRMKTLAEEQFRQVLHLLHKIVLSLLSPEWNNLRREYPDAEKWPPEQLVSWIIDSMQAKINRLEILSRGGREDTSQETMQLQETIQQLQETVRQLQERNQQLESENAQLRVAVREAERLRTGAQLRQKPELPSAAETAIPEVSQWIKSASNGAKELLQIIGSLGLSLREDIARAGGRTARAGSVVELFQELIAGEVITEESLQAEGKGKSPNVVRLSPKGKEAYRELTGQDPVESEFDRLLRRHKSPEQSLLALRARQVLQEFGAEVDLFPEPVPLGDGGLFWVDLIANLEGHRILVECERASARSPRLDKWSAYRAATTDFYFFVPNKAVLGDLITELNLWAFRRIDEAQGVVVHIHQMSEREKGKLWHYTRPLAGTVGRREK